MGKKTAFRKATQQIMTMKTNGTKASHWKHKYKTRCAKGTKRFWKFVNNVYWYITDILPWIIFKDNIN